DRNYQTGFPKNELTVSDVEEFDQNAFFGQKVYPNYRIAGRYKINENTSVKFAGLQIYQFIHSLTNNTTASPIDTWRISTNHLQPQASTQVSIGVF
ncbi:MAG: TonB-dependent receptor, partial [Flavobacteriaceae bacterium]